MRKFTDKKVVAITGASRGLGKALARKLAGSDNVLVLCSKNFKELNSVCSDLKKRGTECYASKIDVSKKADIVKFIRQTLKRFLKIDVLINNAGAIHKAKPLEKITDEEYHRCLKTNLDSVFYALKEVIPPMIKKGSGTIVTISSTAGKRGNPDFAAYSASKFAVTGLMQSAARYLGNYGIRCITVFPSGMNTAMRRYILGTQDANKQQAPKSVAKIIRNAVEDPNKFPNGSEIEIRDGKITSTSVI